MLLSVFPQVPTSLSSLSHPSPRCLSADVNTKDSSAFSSCHYFIRCLYSSCSSFLLFFADASRSFTHTKSEILLYSQIVKEDAVISKYDVWIKCLGSWSGTRSFLKIYSAPYAILQLLEELYSRPWLSLESPRFHRSLDIVSRCPHKNFSALRPKKWAFETEQQSPPSSLAGGRRATEPFWEMQILIFRFLSMYFSKWHNIFL